jgi:hypothetical protein
MAHVDEVDDSNMSLGSVLAMQPAGVLLQRPFPRHLHRQDDVSHGGWSKPSPTSLPVASKIRGILHGSASSSAISFARRFFHAYPVASHYVSCGSAELAGWTQLPW